MKKLLSLLLITLGATAHGMYTTHLGYNPQADREQFQNVEAAIELIKGGLPRSLPPVAPGRRSFAMQAPTEWKWTPLHYYAYQGLQGQPYKMNFMAQFDQKLLRQLKQADNNGLTPLDVAAIKLRREMVNFFLTKNRRLISNYKRQVLNKEKLILNHLCEQWKIGIDENRRQSAAEIYLRLTGRPIETSPKVQAGTITAYDKKQAQAVAFFEEQEVRALKAAQQAQARIKQLQKQLLAQKNFLTQQLEAVERIREKKSNFIQFYEQKKRVPRIISKLGHVSILDDDPFADLDDNDNRNSW